MLYLVNAHPGLLIPRASSYNARSVTTTSASYPVVSGSKHMSLYILSGTTPVYVKFGTSASVSVTTNNGDAHMIVPPNVHLQIALSQAWTHYALVSTGSVTLATWFYE